MHTQVLPGLRIRYAAILDQPHSLKLEFAGKLSSLHDPPPAPSKHLTRCLRNRVQAISVLFGQVVLFVLFAQKVNKLGSVFRRRIFALGETEPSAFKMVHGPSDHKQPRPRLRDASETIQIEFFRVALPETIASALKLSSDPQKPSSTRPPLQIL